MPSNRGLANVLLNRRIVKGDGHDAASHAWPVNDPAEDGSHVADVVAAWVECSNVRVLARTPVRGELFVTFITEHRLLTV